MQEDPTKDIAPQVQSLLAKFSDQLPGFDEAVDTDSSVQAPQNKVDRIYAEMFGGQPKQQRSGAQPSGQPPSQREQQYFDLSGERQQLTRQQGRLESEGRGVHFDQIRQISSRLKEIEGEINELKPEGPGIRMINALNNFVSGAAEMPAGALKGVAALAKQADDLFGTDFQPGDVSDQATYKLGQKISDLAKKHFPTDPVLQEEFTQKLAAGLGSFLSFGVGGLGARAVTGSLRGGQVFAFGAAGLSGTGQQYDEAIQHGATEDDAQLAANWGFLPGVIQVSNTALRVLNRWDKAYAGALKEGIMRRVLESGKTGINEAIVETVGQAGYNKIAQEIYDAERPLIEGLGDAGTVGGSAGFLSDLLMSAFLGRTGGTRGTASPGGTDRPSPSLEKVRIEMENGQDAPTPEELEAAQQAEADKRKPMGVGRYNDEDVTVLGQDNQGDLYIQHPDGRQEHIQKELLEDFVTTDELEVSNAILEGAQQQISNQSQAIQDPETGDVVTPDDPRFPQVQQSAQQAAEQVTQLTMGQGDKRRVANMRQQPGGQYRIDSVDGVPVEELTGTEVNSALNDLAKELEPRGNFEIEAFPVDPNDPMGAMEILVIPQQGSSLDGAETQTEQQGDDTAQPEIEASEQNMEAEIQPEAQETTGTGVNQWKAGDTYTDSRGVSKKIERLGRDFDQDVEVFFDDGTRGLLPKTKQETSGTITEQKEAEEPTSIEAAIEAYEGDSNFTVMDLVNAVESMSDSDQLDQAVRAYREQQRIDTEELAGRNDMDAAEDAFIQALRQHIEQETQPQTDEGQTQPVETSPEGLPESPETTEGGTQVEGESEGGPPFETAETGDRPVDPTRAITEELETPQPEGETSEAFRMVPLSNIQTSVDRFQNRDAEYSQDTVDSIVDDYQAGRLNLDNISPILVWRDPKDNQLYVVGGHSRLEAFRRLGRQNIQTQELTGLTEEQARQRGREDNALGTQESLVEQAKLVREWMGQDMSKAEMDRKARQLFKNNSRLVQAYAALSPSGKALQTLRALEGNQTGDRTRVQDFAKYVGEARLRHPQLTDSHETELFNYLLENDNARTQNQRNFLGFVDEVVSRNSFMGDFDASKPLNIRSVRPKSQLEQQQEQALKEAEKEFNDASKAFQNKVKEIEDRRKAGENISMEAANRTLEKLQQEMLAAQRRVIQERQNTGQTKAAARSQTDIFGSEPQGAQSEQQQTRSEELSQKADQKKEELKSLFAEFNDIAGGQLNVGLDPQLIVKASQIIAKGAELGYVRFQQLAQFVIDNIGADAWRSMFDNFKAAYMANVAMEGNPNGEDLNAIAQSKAEDYVSESDQEITDIEETPEASDESTTATNLESDSPRTTASEQVGEQDVQSERAGDRPGDGEGSQATLTKELQQQGDSGLSDGAAAASRTKGDQSIYTDPGQPRTGTDASGDLFTRRGREDSDSGIPADGRRSESTDETPQTDLNQGKSGAQLTFEQKITQQKQAESVPYKAGDPDNIRESLPVLFPQQQNDVIKAETRFLQPSSYINPTTGMMFTNGTGTGKTYSGLGIAKRFDKAGKKNILIVVPTDHKAKDWIDDGKNLMLNIRQLDGIEDGGNPDEAVVTTYANFRKNESIADRDFDLVIYDESHKIMSSQGADRTAAYQQHKYVANAPSQIYEKAAHKIVGRPESPKMGFEFKYEFEQGPHGTANVYYQRPVGSKGKWEVKESVISDGGKGQETVRAMYHSQYVQLKKDNRARIDQLAEELYDSTKVVFLSATPFSYVFNLDYADGFLFQMDEGTADGYSGYNQPGPREQFFIENFGYKMRYNRLEKPDAEVDLSLMEREFHEKLQQTGALSKRILDLDYDYSRDFILVDDVLGSEIDRGLDVLSEMKDGKELFPYLNKVVEKRFNWVRKNQTLESIKAQKSIPRLQQHLDAGRKIVVFHSYLSHDPVHIFDFSELKQALEDAQVEGRMREDSGIEIDSAMISSVGQKASGTGDMIGQILSEIERFESQYPDLVNLDMQGLKNPVDTILEAFEGRAAAFNGTIAKKQRFNSVQKFNKDDSGLDILVVQMEAGKEGISLHDTTGVKQRVMHNLGLPYKPTDAIQTEGRVYRVGQKSNAIFEYPVLHLNFEQSAFADKISERTKTAENLALGNKARNLELAFTEGYTLANNQVEMSNQGTGGKQADYTISNITPFDRAKTYYYARQKRNSKTKAREGKDYFATPEPLGMKMAQWLMLKPNQKALEPSAGHGAIARFFPEQTVNTFIEPSNTLSAQLAMNANGTVKKEVFEDLHIVNKFDGIAMNPPFGSSGKTAMDHLKKAFDHLVDGGRIVAIIPEGPSMEKRFDAWQESDDASAAHLLMEIKLPAVTFERAGTKVVSRIVVIDKIENKAEGAEIPLQRQIDLSSETDINALFEMLEDLEAPPKTQVDRKKSVTKSETGNVVSDDGIIEIVESQHTRDGYDIWVGKMQRKVDYEIFKEIKKIASDNNGYYSSYNKGGAIPGFIFKTPEDAAGFVQQMNQHSQSGETARFSNTGGDPIAKSIRRNDSEHINAVREAVQQITDQWADSSFVTVVDSSAELPTGLQARFEVQGIEGSISGVYHAGQVYIVADNARSPQAAVKTLQHEVFGHLGLRRLAELQSYSREDYRGRLDQILTDVYSSFRSDPVMQAIKQEYNLDFRRGEDRLIAADEYLSRAAEGNVSETLWDRIVKWVNDTLKALGFDRPAMTKADIKQIIRQSKQVVESGMTAVFRSDGTRVATNYMDTHAPLFSGMRGFGEFYSNAMTGLQYIDQPAATPDQWVKMIADKGGKGTAQELEWIGLQDFLTEYVQTNNVKSVPREVVEQYIRDNKIAIEQVELGGGRTYTAENYEQFPSEVTDVFERHDDDSSAIIKDLEDLGYEVEYGLDGVITSFRLAGESSNDPAKFSEYTLPGGENYKEVLLTLPVDRYPIDSFNDYVKRVLGLQNLIGVSEQQIEIYKESYQSYIGENPPSGDTYRTSHFDQPNILAHVRMNDRQLDNGEKVLFLEELQSDWQQSGRKHGFKPGVSDQKKLDKALSEYEKAIEDSVNYWGGHSSGGDISIPALRKSDPEMNRLMQIREEKSNKYQELYNQFGRTDSSVPDMPYKKTDQWAGMAFRRVLAMAAEQGYDRIAWTTGEQQADRYDLSKHVREVRLYENPPYTREGDTPGGRRLVVYDITSRVVIDRVLSDSQIEEHIGKEAAKKLLDQETEEVRGSEYRSLQDKELKVGGEGMKGFYNKILPKVAGKEAQRFDKKAKVEVVEIDTGRPQNSDEREVFSEWKLDYESGDMTKTEFEALLSNEGFKPVYLEEGTVSGYKPLEVIKSKQLSVKLSFDARKTLEEGIPLFKADAETRFRNTADLDEQGFPYKRRFDNWVRKFQDANIANKRLIEGVRAEGGIINDQNNFYQDAQLRRGRIENQLNKFRNGDLAEFTEVMQRGHNELGITHQDYYKYLQVRHAPDVNKRFKELNGLENASGYSQAEIDQWNATFEEKGWTDFLENEVAPVHDRIVQHNLRMQVAYGLITPQRFAAMKRMYPNYTPMRGFEEFMDVDPTLYVRPERQEGRASKPGDSIAYLIGYTESTIIHGETNLVKEKAGKFAEQNWDRQDLLQLKNVYWRDTGKNDPETGKRIYLAETDRPSVEELMDGRVVRTIDPDQTMAKWTESGNPFTKSERTMRFMRRGKPMVIEFAAPHHATALSNTNIDRIPKTLNWLAKYMGFLRNAYITYSPEFPLRNAFRDGITGLLHVYTDFDTKTAAAIANPKRMSKMYSALWKAFKHENFDSEFGDSVKSFLYHGGKSGYYQLNQMKRLTKDLQEAIERDGSNWYKSKQAMKSFHDWMQSYTTSIENLIRLSGYDYFIKNGVVNPKTGKPYTEKQAASYFKDLTVNFDRKGEYGSVIGLGWIFYNATMQNIARLAEPFFSGDPRRMRRAASVPLIMGGVAYMMSDMLRIGLGVDDDDEYRFDKINDFTIAHRLMIPNFLTDNPGDMLSIPLPYGQNVYWAAGVYANKLSNNQLTTEEVAMNLASLAWQSYNPIGGEAVGAGIVHSGLKTFLPTVTIPPYELATNVDFRGLPIVPERFGREQMAPNYQNYRYYTREWAKKTAKAMNTLSGGDEYTGGLVDVSPNTLEFLINSYLGGAGNFVFTTLDAATQAVNHLSGEDPITGQDLRRFPIARVYFSDVPRSANRNKFYDNVRELERFQWQYAQIADREGYQAAGAFAAENKEKMQLIQLKNAAQSAIRQHFSYLNQLPGDDREKSEEILSRINEFYNEFNREYNRIEGKSASQNPPPRSLSRLLEPIAPPQ